MGGPAPGRVPAGSSPSPSHMPVARVGFGGLGALPLLLILGCALGLAAAAHVQQNCKKTLRTLAFERCSGHRDKRSDLASVTEESRTKKREIISLRKRVGSLRIPIYDTRYDIPRVKHQSVSPINPTGDSDIYRATRKFEFLPEESSSDLGFDVGLEEVVELFKEMYERMPRSPAKTKEESMREFMALAYECCKNQDLCLTKKELIPIHCT